MRDGQKKQRIERTGAGARRAERRKQISSANTFSPGALGGGLLIATGARSLFPPLSLSLAQAVKKMKYCLNAPPSSSGRRLLFFSSIKPSRNFAHRGRMGARRP
jgi:hypothetical protein